MERAEEVGLDGDREGRQSKQCVWMGGESERGGGDRKERETLCQAKSNGHLAWQLVHEAVRLSICQNTACVVLTVS